MAADVLRVAGVDVTYVGASLPSEELVRTRPRLSAVSKGLVARLRKEASCLLRCFAASKLTDDPSMLEDYTAWLRVVMTSRAWASAHGP